VRPVQPHIGALGRSTRQLHLAAAGPAKANKSGICPLLLCSGSRRATSRPNASWRGVRIPTRVVIAFRSYCRRMGRVIVVVLGVVVALFGLLFALQGFGMVGGSPMSNTTTWSVLGPIIALVGVAVAVGAARRRK